MTPTDELKLTKEALALCLYRGVQSAAGCAKPAFLTGSNDAGGGQQEFVPPAHLHHVMVQARAVHVP